MTKNPLFIIIAAIVFGLAAVPASALVLDDGGIHNDPPVPYLERLEVYDNTRPPYNYTTVNINLGYAFQASYIDTYDNTRLNINSFIVQASVAAHDKSLVVVSPEGSAGNYFDVFDQSRVFVEGSAGSTGMFSANDQSEVVLAGGFIGFCELGDESIFVVTDGGRTHYLQGFKGKNAVIFDGRIEGGSMPIPADSDVGVYGGEIYAYSELSVDGRLRIYGGDWSRYYEGAERRLTVRSEAHFYGADFNYSFGTLACDQPDGCPIGPLTGTLADGSPLSIHLFLSDGARLILRRSTDISINNPTLVSRKRVGRFEFEYVFRAQAVNAGHDVEAVQAQAYSVSPYTRVVDGMLAFGDVADGSVVTSADNLVVRHDRRQPFDWEALKWDIQYATRKTTTVWQKPLENTDLYRIGTTRQTGDGGFIVAGYSYFFSGVQGADACLVRTDGDGNLLWSKSFGGGSQDGARTVQRTSDGGYILAGFTESFGAGGYDVYLIKTDVDGNGIWWKAIGGPLDDGAADVRQTSDGGYIIAGYSRSFGTADSNVFLIKTDAAGNELWWRTFSGLSNEAVAGSSVRQTGDGGYILTADSVYQDDGIPDYVVIIKVGADGTQQWITTYRPGTGGGETPVSNYIGVQFSTVEVVGDGYVVAGHTHSGADSDGHGDVYLLKLDTKGKEQWHQIVNGPFLYHPDSSVSQTCDGGYMLAFQGSYWSDIEANFVKLDADGNIQWHYLLPGEWYETAKSVQPTSDGGYIITGFDEGGVNYGPYLRKTTAINIQTCP